jgi:hypothetical protein
MDPIQNQNFGGANGHNPSFQISSEQMDSIQNQNFGGANGSNPSFQISGEQMDSIQNQNFRGANGSNPSFQISGEQMDQIHLVTKKKVSQKINHATTQEHKQIILDNTNTKKSNNNTNTPLTVTESTNGHIPAKRTTSERTPSTETNTLKRINNNSDTKMNTSEDDINDHENLSPISCSTKLNFDSCQNQNE